MDYRQRSPIISQRSIKPRHRVHSHGYDGGAGNAGGATQEQMALKRDARTVDFQTHTFRSVQFTVDTTTQILVAFNPARRYLLIQNKAGVGQNQIQLAFGTSAVSNVSGGFNSIDLPPGTSLDFSGICPNNEVEAICLPKSIVVVLEGLVDGYDAKYYEGF